MIPASATFLGQVRQAAENGATIIQLREKNLSTRDFIQRAKEVLEITRPLGIPLIINDRVDVALAVDADGVHVGQDDMPAKLVRELIGSDKILGVSCTSPEETREVCDEGVADYVGLGTCYPTNTKDVKNVIGPIGIRKLLQVLNKYAGHESRKRIQSVAIGGINHTNAAKVLYQCAIPNCGIDGVAVVSCIMANKDVTAASKGLVEAMKAPTPWIQSTVGTEIRLPFQARPLVHHVTNNVVKNFNANVTLAIGASPIMSELSTEFEEFAALSLPVSFVVNLGTPSPALMDVFLAGIKAYNKTGHPIVFDPVAAGSTSKRLEASKVLLNAGQFSVIKGNVGEIMAIEKLTSSYVALDSQQVTMQGVDSLVTLSDDSVCAIATRVSKDFKCVVVVTGVTNFVVNANTGAEVEAHKIAGGHELMGSVTGTGCSLGSAIGAFIASAHLAKIDMTSAVVLAVQLYNTAGRRAGLMSHGPGSFAQNFLDALAEEAKGR